MADEDAATGIQLGEVSRNVTRLLAKVDLIDEKMGRYPTWRDLDRIITASKAETAALIAAGVAAHEPIMQRIEDLEAMNSRQAEAMATTRRGLLTTTVGAGLTLIVTLLVWATTGR